MLLFEIVAHRGIATEEPENTIPAFLRAIEAGADAVEFDVRLTSDAVPVVYHYCYLDENTSARGPIFEYSYQQLREVRLLGKSSFKTDHARISTLSEVLEGVGGRIGLEIEIKGSEPEAPEVIGRVLNQHKNLWDSIEVSSHEPALLLSIQEHCPGLATDLLFPLSEPWMKPDILAY
jgi:glycerophosphoryl diester phosphodiesterase